MVRAVGRLPARVRTKLLVAFVGTAVLVVVVGLLGLRVLGDSRNSVARLGALQQRAAAYGKLQSDASHVRLLLAENVDSDFYAVNQQNPPSPTEREAAAVDKAIANAVALIAPATSAARLGFVPPPEDESVLHLIRTRSSELAAVVRTLIEHLTDRSSGVGPLRLRNTAERLANDLTSLTAVLANRTTAKADDLIAQNARAYTASRNLFIGVSVGAIVLALLLGAVLSWSLVGPIQRIDTRLAGISSGDFSEHVDVPNRDELGALAANVNRMNDELRHLYQELEGISRHKSEFLATMSHELRTPLNAIIGFSELLELEPVGPLNVQQRQYVEDVLDAGRHLLSLINDVLDLSKIEAGRMEVDLDNVSLRAVLESGITLHAERAAAAGIELGLALDGGDVVVRADERKLRQVVFNLLSNALKFTPPGGSIDVCAQVANGSVEIAVRDTGPGIAPEDQEVIFEEFGQARAGPEQYQEGTGLGLPLSRSFVELHGGRLWVESVPGEGSTFRFTLPRAQQG